MIDEPQKSQEHSYSFSLSEVASWTEGVCPSVATKIRASIPALQRGLVWGPEKNELLWDSILRGFPLGALVLTTWSEKLKKTAEEKDERVTHHLLDGQQRCHAIAMGFTDPFVLADRTDETNSASILWLDLNPVQDRTSTRNYWVRATTTAHPWGFRRDDEAKPLSALNIREALAMVNLDPRDQDYRRPSPVDLWPCKAAASVPVPLAWLLELSTENQSHFWKSLGERAAASIDLRWAPNVHDFCVNPETENGRNHVFKGIVRAKSARLVAIEAPKELLDESQLEKTIGNREGVSNIEQLFQRLNRLGTKLDGEELAYSMIKAYWRDLEEPINAVSKHRMPQARMVSLGVRAALAKDARRNLPVSPTLSALRAIARSEKDKKHIQDFILQDLKGACDLVDHWLKYDPKDNQSGLLPVHITSIAIGSREVYLLLLHFAKQMHGNEEPKNWRKSMQGLATIVHWFAVDKSKVANFVFDRCRDIPSLENIRLALMEAITAGDLSMIHAPKDVGDFIRIPPDNLNDWNWWSPIKGDGNEERVLWRKKAWEGFLGFRSNRELLLYAQRDFIARRFSEYNPARKDLWEAHNRPWDFDHILASYYFYNRKDGGNFRGICGEWGYTIGNLRAWPYEENRSDQEETAADKINGDTDVLRNSFLTADEENSFSGGNNTRHEEAAARLFAEKCQGRLLRIYQTWYESLAISELVQPATSEESKLIPPPPDISSSSRAAI